MNFAQLIFLLLVGSPVISWECWWSGCQPRARRQRACYQPDKYFEVESKSCNRGNMFQCCADFNKDQQNKILLDESESGICSWYGQNDVPQGHPTASGELFDRQSMHAAHKTLPFGSRIRVMNLKSGKTVDVTINDRGPFIKKRILDLTYAAFGMIEDRNKGLIRCSYTILK